jgi:uncharacterized protein
VQDLIVSVADILGAPGRYRDIAIDADLPDVHNALARLGDERPVRARLRAESVVEGVLVTGQLEAVATAECARCLEVTDEPLALEVCELFATSGTDADAEAYRLSGTDMDLRPMLVDAVALALPLRPLCRAECRGLCPHCGRNLNAGACDCATEATDPRWAPLSALRERLESG